MYLFWKILYGEEPDLYEQDPTNPANNISGVMAQYSASTQDKTISYSLGILFILLWGSSTFLNPLLFSFFGKNKATTFNTLFKYVAAFDFLTNIWVPLAYAWVMLCSKVYSYSTRPWTFVVQNHWCCIIGCFSQVCNCRF